MFLSSQPDGTDTVARLLGPADMEGLSVDELCRRLGRVILLGSADGRELMDRVREAHRASRGE